MNRLPQNLQEEIKKKGFIVYHYISFSELMQTVKRDYLDIAAVVNIPFMIFSVIVGIFNPFVLWYSLPLLYFFVFVVLLGKLFWRTQKYLYMRRVIFTQEKILIGEHVLTYDQGWKKGSLLSLYEKEFDEYLTRPSRLHSVITEKEKIFKKQLGDIFSAGKYVSSSRLRSRFGIAILAAVYLYGVSLIVFYFLGIVFGYIFFGIFALFLQLFLFFSQKIEVKIKHAVEKLEDDIQHLVKTEEVVRKKILDFSEGDISDISGGVEENFLYFYENIQEILKGKKKLHGFIVDSQYKNFIDFQKFSQYIKNEYNKPVTSMLHLLSQYSEKISIQQKKLHNTSSHTKAEFSGPLSQKIFRFDQMQKEIEAIEMKMTKMLL